MGLYGNPLVEKDDVLMEIKVSSSMPFWLIKLLEENNVYKTSFSKYGKSYELNFNRYKLSEAYKYCYNGYALT
jgi:hypothetical protein